MHFLLLKENQLKENIMVQYLENALKYDRVSGWKSGWKDWGCSLAPLRVCIQKRRPIEWIAVRTRRHAKPIWKRILGVGGVNKLLSSYLVTCKMLLHTQFPSLLLDHTNCPPKGAYESHTNSFVIRNIFQNIKNILTLCIYQYRILPSIE